MKKAILLLLFLLLSVSQNFVEAQEANLGLKAGINLTNFVGEDISDTDFKVGVHAGPYLRLAFNDRISFQPELLFSTKGARDRYTVLQTEYKRSYTLYYFDIPLLINVQPATGHYFTAGLQPSFLLGDKIKVKTSTTTVSASDNDLYNSFDLGLVAGYMYELGMGLNLCFRFNYGLPYVVEDEEDDDNNHVHNLNLQFSVGYTIGK